MTDSSRTPSALHGIRVVDLAKGVAGQCTAMLLGDYGADVIRPTAQDDSARQRVGDPMWSRNKRVLADPDPAAVRKLIGSADILVVDERPTEGRLPTLDLDLREYQRLVVVATSSYARKAPWPVGGESDPFLRAVGGMARRQSSFDGGPIEPVYLHVVYLQGLWAATVALAAVLERFKSGRGQVCEVDGMHGVLVASATTFVIPYGSKLNDTAIGPGGPNPVYSTYRCSDGNWIFFAALTPKFQHLAFGTLGLPWLFDDERISGDSTKLYQPGIREWVKDEIAQVFITQPRDHWLKVLQSIGCPAAALGERDEWLDHPQVRALGLRVEIEDPAVGTITMPAPLVSLSRTPAKLPAARTFDTTADWRNPPLALEPTGEDSLNGPLSGLKILDLGTVLAGPFAGMLLAELGADVIKVEPPTGDQFRTVAFQYSRGQRGLAIDLGSVDGRAAYLEVIKTADAVIDNFRPGVTARLGIDYDSLRSVRNDVITASISGFGNIGPMAGEPGFDPVLQAMSGMMSAQGGDSDPVFSTLAANDLSAACGLAFGVVVALIARASYGHGQIVETTLAAAAAFMQSEEILRYEGRGRPLIGGRDFRGPHPWDRYYGLSDGWVRIQTDEAGLHALADALDPTAHDGVENIDDLMKAHDIAELLGICSKLDVAVAVARTPLDLLEDTILHEGRYLEEHTSSNGLHFVIPGRFARLSRTERTDSIMPPGLGEHSRAILTEVGIAPEDVEKLIASGCVVQGEPMTEFNPIQYR